MLMPEPISFDLDLYPLQAVETAAEHVRPRAEIRIDVTANASVVYLEARPGEDPSALGDELRTAAFSAAARLWRDSLSGAAPGSGPGSRPGSGPGSGPGLDPWALLRPLGEGSRLPSGWTLTAMTPITASGTTLHLHHPSLGEARVGIRAHAGNPVGIASTAQLDFLLLNDGRGSAPTLASLETALHELANAVASGAPLPDPLWRALQGGGDRRGEKESEETKPRLGACRVDAERGLLTWEIVGLRPATNTAQRLYDAGLRFADRHYVFVRRRDHDTVHLCLRRRAPLSAAALEALAEEVESGVTRALGGTEPSARSPRRGDTLAPEIRSEADLGALLEELAAADAATLGVGFQPHRGPAHSGMGVLNILGTGACDSDCVFCCEKFHPNNRVMPSTDATRQLIVRSSGRFDMLFFASGEPTIHPKLFEYVELAKKLGYTAFGMSSHFRHLSDPRLTLKILRAGFQFFDISLHAADAAAQVEVNPIGDAGASLYEALKGVAVLHRLAEALGIPITVTQKVVVSRLNVTRLEETIRATYERGVRHFILQPVRTVGLPKDRHELLSIPEEEILPHLNRLIEKTAAMGVVLKPYGFARTDLTQADHIEQERNRLKNVSGRSRRPRGDLTLPPTRDTRPADGRFWVELHASAGDRFGFAAEPGAIVLDGAIQRGALVSFGCRMGSCGMCCAQLLSGQVDQSAQIFLSEEQVAKGYVLLCQARPLSDVTFRLCTDDEIDAL